MSDSLEFVYVPSKDYMEARLEERILEAIPDLSEFGEGQYLKWGVKLFQKGFYTDDIVLMLSDLFDAAHH